GSSAFALAHLAARRRRLEDTAEREAREQSRRHAMRRPELALSLVGVDALAIDIGGGIAQLLAPPSADALLDRIGEVRRALATEIGLVLPGVRLRDDLARDPDTYAIRVRDRVVGEGRLVLDRLLAVGDEAVLSRLGFDVESEPVYGLPAAWVDVSDRDRAMSSGALVFDPVSILGSHLAETARRYAAELYGRQELQTLLEHLRASVPALVREIGTDALPIGAVHKALEHLLRERIWPRDPILVLQALVEAPSRDPRELAETARRAVVPDLLRRRGVMRIEPLILDPDVELELSRPHPDPELALALRERLAAHAGRAAPERATVVCTAPVRPVLADLAARGGIQADVFSYAELPGEMQLVPVEVVNVERRAVAV
ncbi:MAG: flagellar biosynthesis protein FlhA, partial [Candidatus Eremiobacteraeota bacterium]|nr:flagellar biosynthesis protein FlhA [Candidatus Eremiobacteraeota bacterium]